MKGLKLLLGGVALAATLIMPTRSFAAEVPETAEASNEVQTAILATDIAEEDSLGILTTRAGNETWTGSGFGGAFSFVDYNLTPVKTMGKSGTLLISGYFYGNDGYADSSPIKLTFEIRSTSGAVLARTIVPDTRNGNIPFAVSCQVTKGQKVQLFMDASSIGNPPGRTRGAYISYNYDLY